MKKEEALALIERLSESIKGIRNTARSEKERGEELSGAFYYGFASGLELARALINEKI